MGEKKQPPFPQHLHPTPNNNKHNNDDDSLVLGEVEKKLRDAGTVLFANTNKTRQQQLNLNPNERRQQRRRHDPKISGLPNFSRNEIVLGSELGRGQYGIVYSVDGFDLPAVPVAAAGAACTNRGSGETETGEQEGVVSRTGAHRTSSSSSDENETDAPHRFDVDDHVDDGNDYYYYEGTSVSSSTSLIRSSSIKEDWYYDSIRCNIDLAVNDSKEATAAGIATTSLSCARSNGRHRRSFRREQKARRRRRRRRRHLSHSRSRAFLKRRCVLNGKPRYAVKTLRSSNNGNREDAEIRYRATTATTMLVLATTTTTTATTSSIATGCTMLPD